MPKVACIDVGTNSVLLLIAEFDGDGEMLSVVERATITRLGEGVDRDRRLLERAMRRTLDCLRDYALELGRHDVLELAVVGTSALRDARGNDAFRGAVRDVLGRDLEVISGEREARLTFRGALSGLAVQGRVLVVDIGGGSTEIILGDRTSRHETILSGASLDMGSVRFLERYLQHDPPHVDEVHALRKRVRQMLSSLAHPGEPVRLIGVAGTVTTLAAIAARMEEYDPERVHGAKLSESTLGKTLDRLLKLPVSERRKLPGLPAERADAIAAGGLILHELLTWANSTSLLVSDRGVRWGVIDELRETLQNRRPN